MEDPKNYQSDLEGSCNGHCQYRDGVFSGETTIETHITLLSIGLAALAIAALQKGE